MPDIIECAQGTDEWFQARLGIPTASMFATVMAKGRGGGESKTRKTYLYKLAGEIVTGQPMDTFTNAHMEHGHEVEAEARAAYELISDADVNEVGFIRSGRVGCSPDGLVGDDGMVEIKRKLPHLLIETFVRGDIPPEHVAQVQGQMWVANRDWVDFVAYYPGMPLFTKRVERDQDYCDTLAASTDAFLAELDEVVTFIQSIAEG